MEHDSENDNCRDSWPQGHAPVSLSTVVKVWDIVNRHYELSLEKSNRSATKSRAELDIQCQVKELRDHMAICCERLKAVEAYVSELQRKETGTLTETSSQLQAQTCAELEGEWHFLYLGDNSVFGYMKLVPDSVSVCQRESLSTRRAEFTLPAGVLKESLFATGENVPHSTQGICCPCCRLSFAHSEFWKHALSEIAEKGNRVPAWQSVGRAETPRWIVEESAGWTSPIYRPRVLCGTCEIGRSLAELNLRNFLTDHDFSKALDDTFECLATQLRR